MPQIYIADLAAYNNGKLHGVWIDADQDPEDIMAAIQKMLSESPEEIAEDWAIHDAEGFDPYPIAENEDLETVSRLAAAIEEHGEIFAAYAAEVGDMEEAADDFEDAYKGTFANPEDFAYQFCGDVYGKPPEWLESYVDYKRMGQDMFCGDFFGVQLDTGKIAVFHR